MFWGGRTNGRETDDDHGLHPEGMSESALARRAADGSPRREPWGNVNQLPASPEGDTSTVDRRSVALRASIPTWADPTAHAVGYRLPPSGLKTTDFVPPS